MITELIITIAILLIAFCLICINIWKLLVYTDIIANFISGLTPDTKLSEIKNPAFSKLRYTLIQNIYSLKYSLRLNIIILCFLIIGIILLFENITTQYKINQLNQEFNIENLKNYQTINILEEKYDSISLSKKFLDIRVNYLLDSLTYEKKENERLKKENIWLRHVRMHNDD